MTYTGLSARRSHATIIFMRTQPVTGQTVWDYLAMALTTSLVLLASGILLLRANGYVIDFTQLRARQVGLLVVQSETNNLVLSIDGQESLDLETRRELLREPGRLQLQAVSDSLRPWQKEITITPGRTSLVPGLRLFPIEPVVEVRPATNEELHAPLIARDLVVRERELYRRERDGNTTYVTRFSLPIRSAIWLDQHHIAYQTGGDVHVMDSDGSNDVSIHRVSSVEPVRLYGIDRGGSLGLVSGLSTTVIHLSRTP